MGKERSMRVWEIADEVYGQLSATLKEKKVDVGEGIAVCRLLAGWLSGSADAQTTLHNSEFVGVPYYGKEKENEQDQ